MSWYVSYDKLGQKQLQVLNSITQDLDSHHWVQGFAGTGKTLVITHLMERICSLYPKASICFITYTHALKDLIASGLHNSVAARVSVSTHKQFLSDGEIYDFVLLDEVQDISPGDLQNIKRLSRRLYLAGDGDQRIYDNSATEEQINIAVAPKTWKLVEIFRLTKLLQQVAQSILPSTKLIGGLHSSKDSEVTIRLIKHQSTISESLWVWNEAKRRSRPSDPAAILFSTHKAIYDFSCHIAKSLGFPDPPKPEGSDYREFNKFWGENNINLMYFGNRYGGDFRRSENAPMIFIMTFHSSKGLDFKNVFIPRMDSRAFIAHSSKVQSDPDLERRILFVAVTRSRENLFISYSGNSAHSLLDNLPPSVITNVVPTQHDAADDSEDFF